MKKPTLIAYAVRQRDGQQKAVWTRIGAAWSHHRDGGLSIELDALPTTGRLVLLPPSESDGDAS
ncbi:hypothetical protein [uncultured Bradyrhizobium sp.]|jgi:ketosteroid isomerase-like protein|uniref:hypothetical protein n=1 Tax=uncultured Bradyrhizobium sp. TaxID=199684 RepID=UPI00263038A7|nr:hypothetical protein [uncultured Bradyrhizobium sp.]